MPQIPQDKHSILLSFYDKGMTSKRSPLVGSAAVAAGLPEEIVKNWVSNRTRNPRGQRPRCGSRELSGYNLYCREHLKNKGDIKEAGAAWAVMNEEDKEEYRERARAGRVGGDSEDSKLLRRKRLIRQLKNQVVMLEKEGVQVGVMVYEPSTKSNEMMCTKDVDAFMQSSMIGFSQLFEGGKKNTKVSHQGLLKKVQDLFNRKYEEAGGRGRFPYKSASDRGKMISVLGLPVPFKKPSAYGTKQLMAILDCSDRFTIQIEHVPELVEEESERSQDIVQEAMRAIHEPLQLAQEPVPHSTTTINSDTWKRLFVI